LAHLLPLDEGGVVGEALFRKYSSKLFTGTIHLREPIFTPGNLPALISRKSVGTLTPIEAAVAVTLSASFAGLSVIIFPTRLFCWANPLLTKQDFVDVEQITYEATPALPGCSEII